MYFMHIEIVKKILKPVRWKNIISYTLPIFVILGDFINYFSDPSSITVFNKSSPSLLSFTIGEIIMYIAYAVQTYLGLSIITFLVNLFMKKPKK